MYVGEIALNDHLVCLAIQITVDEEISYSQHPFADVTVLYLLLLNL